MNQLYYTWLSLVVGTLLLSSCSSTPSASKYAQKFCDCSADFAKAEIQKKNGRIDALTYEQIVLEHDACLGEEDPLSGFQDNPEKLTQFKADFLVELEKTCPEVARNLNF